MRSLSPRSSWSTKGNKVKEYCVSMEPSVAGHGWMKTCRLQIYRPSKKQSFCFSGVQHREDNSSYRTVLQHREVLGIKGTNSVEKNASSIPKVR